MWKHRKWIMVVTHCGCCLLPVVCTSTIVWNVLNSFLYEIPGHFQTSLHALFGRHDFFLPGIFETSKNRNNNKLGIRADNTNIRTIIASQMSRIGIHSTTNHNIHIHSHHTAKIVCEMERVRKTKERKRIHESSVCFELLVPKRKEIHDE